MIQTLIYLIILFLTSSLPNLMHKINNWCLCPWSTLPHSTSNFSAWSMYVHVIVFKIPSQEHCCIHNTQLEAVHFRSIITLWLLKLPDKAGYQQIEVPPISGHTKDLHCRFMTNQKNCSCENPGSTLCFGSIPVILLLLTDLLSLYFGPHPLLSFLQ